MVWAVRPALPDLCCEQHPVISLDFFAFDRAVDGIDQRLNFDEFDPRSFGLVAIKWRGQYFGEGIAILDHAFQRLFQRFNSFAHFESPRSVGPQIVLLALGADCQSNRARSSPGVVDHAWLNGPRGMSADSVI